MKRLTSSLALVVPIAIVVAACGGGAASPSPSPDPTKPVPPASLRDKGELKWSLKTKGAIWGSVAVRDGVAYVGSNDGRLYAADAKTGAQKWTFETKGEVRTTPAFAGDSIVFASDDGNVYALDLAGKERWHTDIHSNHARTPLDDPNMGATYDYDFLASSPVVAGDRIFAGSSDGNVYALDSKTGKVAWTFKTGDRIRATPAVANGVVFIGSWDSYMYAIKADSGEQVWKYQAGTDGTPKYLVGPVQSTATVKDGVVYCASRKAATFALDEKTGKELWTLSNGQGNWYESSPVLANGNVYIGTSAAGNLVAAEAATGGFVGSFNFGTATWSTPLVVGDTVFIGAEAFLGAAIPENGGLWAVRLVNGIPIMEKWSYKTTETLEPTGIKGVNSSPLLVDGLLYVGGLDGQLYAFAV